MFLAYLLWYLLRFRPDRTYVTVDGEAGTFLQKSGIEKVLPLFYLHYETTGPNQLWDRSAMSAIIEKKILVILLRWHKRFIHSFESSACKTRRWAPRNSSRTPRNRFCIPRSPRYVKLPFLDSLIPRRVKFSEELPSLSLSFRPWSQEFLICEQA